MLPHKREEVNAKYVLDGWRLVKDLEVDTLDKEEAKTVLKDLRYTLEYPVKLNRSLVDLQVQLKDAKNQIETLGKEIKWHKLRYAEALDKYLFSSCCTDLLSCSEYLEEHGRYFWLMKLHEYISEFNLNQLSLTKIMIRDRILDHLNWFRENGWIGSLQQPTEDLRDELIRLCHSIQTQLVDKVGQLKH